MASKMTFHESYGDVSVAQLRAYKRYGVSPSDHNDLVRVYGESNHDLITMAVVEFSPSGFFSAYHLAQASLAFYD